MVVLADRYELGDPVGAGGMARVMRARDLLLERPVAVKLLREDIASDAQVRDRFLREARTAANFNHPNAVAVFDSGDDDGDPWIVMELIEGEDLNQRIRRTGPLQEVEMPYIADCVLSALEAAHRSGIVHRDVKPANIMLLDNGSVKLADFGIAKSVQDAAQNLTGTGQIIGTARYLSPEQVSGKPATAASDVYAMGIVLYEMLAGHAPYTGSDPIAVAVAHTRGPVPDVAAALPHISPHIAAVITRALAKDPADRYADAGQMRHALLGDTRPHALAAPARSAAAGSGATRTLVLDDEAPTLEPAFPAPAAAQRRRAWLLPVLLGLAFLTAIALLAASMDATPTEITTDAGAAQDEPVDARDEPADSGAAEPPPAAGDAADAQPKGEAKGRDKNKGKANGKAKGKKR